MTPTWLSDLFAGLMIAIAGYCAGRVVYARLWKRPSEHDVDVLHVLMGVAMAGMLVARLSFWNSRIWEVLFVVAAGWFVVRGALAARGVEPRAARAAAAHRVPYVLACAAMLYMYLAPIAAGGGDMPGMVDSAGDMSAGASRYPLLGLVLAVSMVSYAVLVLDRTVLAAPFASSSSGASAGALPRISAHSSHCGQIAPRTVNSCHIAMSITMAYLLVVML